MMMVLYTIGYTVPSLVVPFSERTGAGYSVSVSHLTTLPKHFLLINYPSAAFPSGIVSLILMTLLPKISKGPQPPRRHKYIPSTKHRPRTPSSNRRRSVRQNHSSRHHRRHHLHRFRYPPTPRFELGFDGELE
jgi:hypothetical protein